MDRTSGLRQACMGRLCARLSCTVHNVPGCHSDTAFEIPSRAVNRTHDVEMGLIASSVTNLQTSVMLSLARLAEIWGSHKHKLLGK